VSTELRPQNTRDQIPHAALTREVFILSNDTHDVSLAVVILALCVVVTEVTATGVCSAKIVSEATCFLITAAVGVDARLGPLVPTGLG
jgi:hypothetical protein